MTANEDSALQALFANAEQELPDETFTAEVMVEVDRLKRRSLYRGIAGSVVAVPVVVGCAWGFAGPLQSAAYFLNQWLSLPLIDLAETRPGNNLLAQLFYPANNVAAALVLALGGMRFAYRKLFSYGA